jgi:hypothetical protein
MLLSVYVSRRFARHPHPLRPNSNKSLRLQHQDPNPNSNAKDNGGEGGEDQGGGEGGCEEVVLCGGWLGALLYVRRATAVAMVRILAPVGM